MPSSSPRIGSTCRSSLRQWRTHGPRCLGCSKADVDEAVSHSGRWGVGLQSRPNDRGGLAGNFDKWFLYSVRSILAPLPGAPLAAAAPPPRRPTSSDRAMGISLTFLRYDESPVVTDCIDQFAGRNGSSLRSREETQDPAGWSSPAGGRDSKNFHRTSYRQSAEDLFMSCRQRWARRVRLKISFSEMLSAMVRLFHIMLQLVADSVVGARRPRRFAWGECNFGYNEGPEL